VYKYLIADQRWKFVEPSNRILSDFIHLADGPPERILAYAKKWGVMGICEHGLPASHNPLPLPVPSIFSPDSDNWCKPQGWTASWRPERWEAQGWEPLEVWWQFARRARAILGIAAQLYEEPTYGKEPRFGEHKDWETIYKDRPKNLGENDELILDIMSKAISGRRQAWESLSSAVNEWLFIANVRPESSLTENGLTFNFGIYGSLFGALASQLLLAVTRTRGIAFCSDCGKLYTPKFPVRSGKNHFCSDCGKPGAWRLASRKKRQRKAQLI
jgi:hypothetical protein